MKTKCRQYLIYPLFFLVLGLHAQVLPPDFFDQRIYSLLDFPAGITFDANGQGYIWQKRGVVRILRPNNTISPQALIDISEEVSNWKDHGLMGFALDRDFLSNGYFYLLYAVDLHHYHHYGTPAYHPDSTIAFQATFGRVTRYQANPATGFTTLIPDSRKVLLGIEPGDGIPITWEFHGLGSIIAGSDGTLLISCGDGTSSAGPDKGGDEFGTLASQAIQAGIMTPNQDLGAYRAQYRGSLNGKILRIDPESGEGHPTNPYYQTYEPRSPQSRIWAMGLRNPYRIVRRPGTGSHYPQLGDPGDIFIGDVGNSGWEEINVADTAGLNFGWPLFEGFYWEWQFFLAGSPPHPDAPNPLYSHDGCTTAFFSFQDLMRLPSPSGTTTAHNPCDLSIAITDSLNVWTQRMPTLSWSNSQWNPPIRTEILTFHELGHPTGLSIADSLSTVEGEVFGGYSSLAGVFYPGQQFPEEYHGKYFGVDFSGWIKVFDFDENNQLKSIRPFHQFAGDIIHLAYNPANGSLYYINLQGHIRRISYGGNPPPVAVIETDKTFGPGPLTVQFSAASSTDDLPIAAYYWDFGDGHTSSEIAPVHTYIGHGDEPSGFTVTLTITDSLGLTDTAEKIIGYNNTPPIVQISSINNGDRYPPGHSFVVDLRAQVQDAESPSDSLHYEWRSFLHHNAHFHPDPPLYNKETFLLINNIGCDGEDYWFRIELKVTDPQGLSGVSTRNIYPDCHGEADMEWLQADAQVINNKIQLRWRVDDLSDIDSFEIQRTADFFHFTPVDVVPVEPTPANIHIYDDRSPVHGANIYRHKSLATRPQAEFSDLIIANFPAIVPIKVYPNPSHGPFWLALEQVSTPKIGVEMYSANGVRRLQTQLAASPGAPFSHLLDASFLESGLYYYRINDGGKTYVGKILLR